MNVRTLLMAALVISPSIAAAQTAAPAARPAQAESAARPAASASTLDYEFFKNRVQPIFLQKRPGHARCIQCHETGAPRLQALPPNAKMWNEDQSKQNFTVWSRMVVPGNPNVSKMLVHPLAKDAGGDVFHGGGQHWKSKDDPEWQVLAAWVRGEKWSPEPLTSTTSRKTRIIQTNSAGDSADVIDPATNKVVGVV